MKQLINYQDNIFFIQNAAICLEEAINLELNSEFTGQLLESLIESLHISLMSMYKNVEANSQLKDYNEVLRLCVLADTSLCTALQQILEEKHVEILQSFKKLNKDSLKSILAWHDEKTTSLLSKLSSEEHESGDKLSGLSSDELSGLLG